MKKTFRYIVGLILGITLVGAMTQISHAVLANDVFISSYSATSNNRGNLCSGKRGFLSQVCVVDSVAASTAAIYNDVGVFSTSTLTGVIDTSETKNCMSFKLNAPKGLYLDQFGTSGIVVFYECY